MSSVKKFIYQRPDVKLHEGKKFVNIHMLKGYCPQTIPYFLKMIEEVRKDFPFIPVEKFELGVVNSSQFFNRFTIISWGGYVPVDLQVPNDWFQYETGQMEYCW